MSSLTDSGGKSVPNKPPPQKLLEVSHGTVMRADGSQWLTRESDAVFGYLHASSH